MAALLEWKWIITTVVGIIGAIVGITKIVMNMRRLRVTISAGCLAYTNNTLGEELMLIIEVSNHGNKRCIIDTPKLVLPNKRALVFFNPQSDVRFPYHLEEGADCRLWVEIKDVVSALKGQGLKGEVVIRAEVKEGGGRRFRSKATPINIDSNWELKENA